MAVQTKGEVRSVELTSLERALIVRAINTEMNLLVRLYWKPEDGLPEPFKTQHAALLVAMERIDR